MTNSCNHHRAEVEGEGQARRGLGFGANRSLGFPRGRYKMTIFISCNDFCLKNYLSGINMILILI